MESHNLFYSKIQLLFSLLYKGYLRDIRLFKAFLNVNLQDFVPDSLNDKVRMYVDAPVLFYFEEEFPENLRTISAPHMISIMLQNLILNNDDDLLILGAKSGYIATLANNLAPDGKINILEANSAIARITKENIEKQDLQHKIDVIIRNPLEGMPERVPWQKILITGAIDQHRIYPLLKQLDPNQGVLFAPIGSGYTQVYTQILRIDDKYYAKKLLQVRFTPLVTKIELDEIRLITDEEEFEILDDPGKIDDAVEDFYKKETSKPILIHESDIVDEIGLEPQKITDPFEIKPQSIVVVFMENMEKTARLLKKEDDIDQWVNCIDNFEIMIEILKKIKFKKRLQLSKIEKSINQIKTYNLIRKELDKDVNPKSSVIDKKIEIINKQCDEITNLQSIIAKEMQRYKEGKG